MKIKTTFLLSFILVLLWSGCKKDPPCDDPLNPECPNYDKCLTAVRTDAEFGFFADVGGGGFLPYRDSIPVGLNGEVKIFFRASDNRMSRYEWTVGSDPRVFRDSVFFLWLPGIAGWINVALTTFNDRADVSCFPGDSGLVTVNKAFYLKTYIAITREEELAQYPIFGTYRGHPVGRPQDTAQIIIDYPYLSRPGISNFFPGCAEIRNATYYNTHYFMVNGTVGPNSQTCHKPYVLAELASDNKTLTIDYAVTQNGQRVEGKWIGQKIN